MGMGVYRSCIVSLAVLLSACTGVITDGDGRDSRVLDDGEDGPIGVGRLDTADEMCADLGLSAATSPFSRLSREEYNATVRDLLGDDSRPADGFPSTSSGGVGFEVGVSPVQYEAYADAARTLAETAVRDLTSLHPCDATADGDEVCARSFIREVGLRAYRRPLDTEMENRLYDVFAVGLADGGYEAGIRLTLSTMLQSPFFLYKGELDRPDGASVGEVVPLSHYERASRLSYLVWGSMPDDVLFAAAAAGELDTPEQMGAQARRLLEDPRARESVLHFYTRWLGLELEAATVAGDETLGPALQHETERFVEHVIFEQRGDLRELLTADYSFANEQTAAIYGIDGITGADYVRVDLDPTQRAGILTHPSLMAQTASEGSATPVFRGLIIREQLFCQTLPEPPDTIPAFSESGTETDTLQDRLEQHRADPACAGCHSLMDPLGFGFEHYDEVGRYRTETLAGPVDARGDVTQTGDADGEFEGAVELAHRLAASEDVRQCMANQWLRFGLRRLEGAQDGCSLRRMDEAFAASGYDLLELVVALTQTDAFLHRRIGEGEAP